MLKNFLTRTGKWALEYRGNYSSAADLSTYTTGSIAIGSPSIFRRVVVGIVTYLGASNILDTSVVVGGVSLSHIARYTTNGTVRASLWQGLVPTGTTATATVTFGATMQCCGVALWTLDGKSLHGIEVAGPLAGHYIADGSFPRAEKGNAIIGIMRRMSDRSVIWDAKLTEHFDSVIQSGVSGWSGGSTLVANTLTPYNIDNVVSAEEDISPLVAVRFY